MWIDTGVDSESCTFVILNSLTQSFLWVSYGQSFWFSWLWICIWYILGSSNMCVHISQPSWILVKRPMGRLIFHFWPPRVLLVWKVLTLGMGNMWSFISYMGRLSLSYYSIIFISECGSTGNRLRLFALQPIYLLSQDFWYCVEWGWQEWHPCFVFDLRGEAFSFSTWRMISVIGLSCVVSIVVQYVSSILLYWKFLIINECWILSSTFCTFVHLLRWSYDFYPSFCSCGVSHWFAEYEPSLRLWNTSPWEWCMIRSTFYNFVKSHPLSLQRHCGEHRWKTFHEQSLPGYLLK